MTDDKLYEALDNGAVLEVKLAGVTFSCLSTGRTRQAEITKLTTTTNVPLTLVPEPSNVYDSNAIRVDANGVDIGYLPKKGTAFVQVNGKTTQRLTRDNINQVVGNCPFGLIIESHSIYGGYMGKNYGVSIRIAKGVARTVRHRKVGDE